MNRFPARGQSGVSIVELMVAMLVGSVVILGTVQIFNANRQTFRMQDAMSVTQETGTFALDFIGRDLLRAGYQATVSFDWNNTKNNDGNGNDTLGIVYNIDNKLLGVTSFCTGDSAATYSIIENYYYIAYPPAQPTPSLMCQGGSRNASTGAFTAVGNPQVLVDNVESFQVLFGVVLNCNFPMSAADYVNASAMASALSNASNNTGANCTGVAPQKLSEVQVVRSVRIALLLKTGNVVDVTVPATQTYTVLDQVIGAPTIQPNDGHLRRLFTKTIELRASVDPPLT